MRSPVLPSSPQRRTGPESRNAAHKIPEVDMAKHTLAIDGLVVGALITGLDDTSTTRRNNHRSTSSTAQPPEPGEETPAEVGKPSDGETATKTPSARCSITPRFFRPARAVSTASSARPRGAKNSTSAGRVQTPDVTTASQTRALFVFLPDPDGCRTEDDAATRASETGSPRTERLCARSTSWATAASSEGL